MRMLKGPEPPLPAYLSGVIFCGSGCHRKHLDVAQTEFFDDGENLLAAITGEVRESAEKKHGGFSFHSPEKRKGGVFSTHYLLATDCRVVFWGRGVFRSSHDTFPYRHIRSVEVQKGIMHASIVLDVGHSENFANVNPEDAAQMARVIRAQVMALKT